MNFSLTHLPFFKYIYSIFLINILIFILLKHYIESGEKYPKLYNAIKLSLVDALFSYSTETDAYIINSYYYPKSKSLGENALAMVLLVNTNTMRDISKIQMRLVASNGTDNVEVVPKFMRQESNSACAYVSIVAKTKLLPGLKNLEITNGDSRMQIPFRLPKTSTLQPVIICISPQFLSEQWQLFITQAHVARRFGGHLHLYITSMIGTFYHLVKEYEKHGYVTVDYWVRPKFSKSQKSLEPNANSDWRNQAGANTDCLLQYKEAARFITFVDLDDVLFPKKGDSYYDEFSFLSFTNPHIQTFIYDRREYLVYKQSKLSLFNFKKTFGHTFFVPGTLTGKPMTRPSSIHSMSIHLSYNTPDKRRMYVSGNFFLHLQKPRNFTDPVKDSKFKESPELWGSYNNQSVMESLQMDLERMMSIPEIQLISQNLQKDIFYLPLMYECYYGKNFKLGKCMNAEGCEIPQREDVKCIHSDADYVSGPRMSPITFHYHRNPRFLINVDCSV